MCAIHSVPALASACHVFAPQVMQTHHTPGQRCVVRYLSLLVLAACAHASFDEPAVRNVLLQQRDAWNRGDLEGYMAGYAHSPDLVFTSGGKIRRGWDETYAKYKAKYGGDKAGMGHLDFEVVSVQKLGDSGAIVLGRWKLTDTPNAGAGVFSVALEHRPEGWRIVHDHTSSDSP